MKICAYVNDRYAKQTYSKECMDVRQFCGLKIIINELERYGYTVEYAGSATVHEYDIVLISITAFCDWWTFINEKAKWRKGNYKVLVGGAGCLNITPLLPHFYAAMIGRGENLIVPLVDSISNGERYEHESIVYSDSFSQNKIYKICQNDESYPYALPVQKGEQWREGQIGCNHRCLFCSYTYSRKQNFKGAFSWNGTGGAVNMSERECALLDYENGTYKVNFDMLRTTAIDGCSEKIRFGVGKKIKNSTIIKFLSDASRTDSNPRLIRFFNIIGYPSECLEDYEELVEVFRKADSEMVPKSKKWLISLQNNPFIPYPATPMACAPMSKKDYRGGLRKELKMDAGKFRLFYGGAMDLLESWTIEGLPQIALNAIIARGDICDTESVTRVACSNKFQSASAAVKMATLEKYFNLDTIFGKFTLETLPTRWLRTWCPVEKAWGKTPLEIGGD